MACGAPSARAAAGDPDPAFSDDGRVALLSAGPFVARAVALQANGRILVGGAWCDPGASGDATCLADGDSSFRLARLTADGGLDSEFGDRGFVTTQIGSGRSQAFDVLALDDGSIVAGGVAHEGGHDVFALARYDQRGALDRSFGDNGVVLAPVGRDFAAIGDLAAGPDGTIYASGQAVDPNGQARTAVARFTADGALDRSYGDRGITIAGAAYGYGLGAIVDPSGAATVAGIASGSTAPETYRFGELRLTPTGATDQGFGSGGSAQQAVGGSASFANALLARPGGGWVAAGAATGTDNRQAMALVQGVAGGGLDDGFGTGGVTLVPVADGAVANDAVALDDGRVVAVGQAAMDGGYAFATARVLGDGRLDPTFGIGGVTTLAWDRFPVARATAGALEPDGRLISVGIGCSGAGSGTRCDGGTAVLLVARQLADPPAPAPPPLPPPSLPPLTAMPQRDRHKPTAHVRRLPRRITRARLRRHGLPVRVRASERVRADVRLSGRRHHGRKRVTLAHVRRRRPERRFSVRLRPGRKALRRARTGVMRLALRLTDRAGNTRRRKIIVRLR